jgi:hypothetical protein
MIRRRTQPCRGIQRRRLQVVTFLPPRESQQRTENLRFVHQQQQQPERAAGQRAKREFIIVTSALGLTVVKTKVIETRPRSVIHHSA